MARGQGFLQLCSKVGLAWAGDTKRWWMRDCDIPGEMRNIPNDQIQFGTSTGNRKWHSLYRILSSENISPLSRSSE